ncbi:MAG: hypothetical protein L3J58_12435 [Emcibacter sp.]|nr:hypothetical protein [Emcibacter sp.]
MKFVRNNQLLHKLLLVDGVGRSGKVMLAEIMTCFETVEKQDYHEFLEYIPLAYKYGKIEKDIAIAILKTQIDTELYNGMIGRRINARATDYTSIYKYHSPEIYLKRASMEDGPVIADRVAYEKPVYMAWCHDMVQKSDIVFEAFGDKLCILYMNRRPIDIIYEWSVKNFGDRVGSDPTEMQYLIDYNGENVPELALGWEKEYLKASPIERIVKMIHTSFDRNYQAIKKSPHKDNIIIVDFETLVTSPSDIISSLSSELNLKVGNKIDYILTREYCPRELSISEYKEREKNIFDQISPQNKELVLETNKLYDLISDHAIK